MRLGKTENYYWLVSSEEIRGAIDIVVEQRQHQYLHITSFDSGPLTLTQEEQESGWSQENEVSLSPRLNSKTAVPHDQYDEYYLSSTKLRFPSNLEVFVNYGAFTLEHPDELTKDDDPTWERNRCDFLYPFQERFWQQLSIIDPQSYVAMGDHDIFVSKNESFIMAVHRSA